MKNLLFDLMTRNNNRIDGEYVPTKRICKGVNDDGTECEAFTTERKPYCINHLDGLNYVQDLKVRLAKRQDEAAKAKQGEVDIDGPRAAEILKRLEAKKAMTLKKLARDCEVTMPIAKNYVKALARAGFVRYLELGTSRGTLRPVVQFLAKKVAPVVAMPVATPVVAMPVAIPLSAASVTTKISIVA